MSSNRQGTDEVRPPRQPSLTQRHTAHRCVPLLQVDFSQQLHLCSVCLGSKLTFPELCCAESCAGCLRYCALWWFHRDYLRNNSASGTITHLAPERFVVRHPLIARPWASLNKLFMMKPVAAAYQASCREVC